MTFRPPGDRPAETLLGWDGRENMVSAGHHDQLGRDTGAGAFDGIRRGIVLIDPDRSARNRRRSAALTRG
jgi:hypothetical protein